MSQHRAKGALASAPDHRDVDAPDLALGTDLHRLLVAGGPQRQVGRESGSLDEYLDLAAARRALKIAENVAAGFAPAAGNAVALAGHVAAQVEFVAIAGAMKTLLQAKPAAIDLVIGPASNLFRRAVGKRHGPVSGPRAAKTGKRA